MRVHVTGASGYLGAALLRAAPDASRERVEVRDPVAIRELMTRVRPDVVIHTAYRQDGTLILGGPGVASSKHERAACDPTMTFYDDEVRSPIQVDDLAAALLELGGLDDRGVLHVAGADSLPASILLSGTTEPLRLASTATPAVRTSGPISS